MTLPNLNKSMRLADRVGHILCLESLGMSVLLGIITPKQI